MADMLTHVPRPAVLATLSSALVLAAVLAAILALGGAGSKAVADATDNSASTVTPIKHVVVIFDENESFDHYFGTYPYAANTDGTKFTAAPRTPGLAGSDSKVSTLLSAGLLPKSTLPSVNPNRTDEIPNPNAYQPQRIASSQALTCGNNHDYTAEQRAVDNGAMDKFVESTSGSCTTSGYFSSPGLGLDYFDGNTVSALWSYAQNFAMSDNSWDATFGPSTPGALSLVAGNTYTGWGTTITADPDPNADTCGTASGTHRPSIGNGQQNIGDVLDAANVTWGWFEGGFSNCGQTIQNINNNPITSYVSHHDPFQYFASTWNPDHVLPRDGAEIGFDGAANHQYDTTYFEEALNGTDGAALPAVSFVKPPAVDDGHPASSDPLDEQMYLTKTINAIQRSRYWPSTAIIIAYDDSDGWYDHVPPTISNSSNDASLDSAVCTNAAAEGVPALDDQADRCGPSQRLPFLVISPYAKRNYVDHTEISQPSILRFIEENWKLPGIGGGSLDASAGSIDGMFDFQHPQQREVLLDERCEPSPRSNVYLQPAFCMNPAFGAVSSTPAVSVPPKSEEDDQGGDEQSGGDQGPAGTPPPAQSSPTPPKQGKTKAYPSAAKANVGKPAYKDGVVSVGVKVSGRGTLRVEVKARRGKKTVTLGTATVKTKNAGLVPVEVRLSKSAKAELRQGSLKTTISVTFMPAGGKPAVAREALVIRRGAS